MLAENKLHNLRASAHAPRTIIATTHTNRPLSDRNTIMTTPPSLQIQQGHNVLSWERDVEITLANGDIIDAVLYWEDGIGYDLFAATNQAELSAFTQNELYELDEATR
jgi:hypothetical protein